MASKEPKHHEILNRLADAGVEFVIVGMAAAVLQGVTLATWDLDIVHRRTPENIERLLRVLEDLQAISRHDPRRLKPNSTHLTGPGHVLMETHFGDFDCLGAIDGGRKYEDLVGFSVVLDFEGRSLLVLALRELLAVKTRAGRPKDLAVVPFIQSTIDEIESEERG